MMCKGESKACTREKRHRQHPKEIIKTTHTTVARDNNGKKVQKKNIAEVACRRALLKRSGVAAAGKYLWSCHGTRPRLRILFKQSLSEHREGDGDTVSLRLPCGPLSQHHTPGKQWSHAGTGAARLKIAAPGPWRVTGTGAGGPGLGLRMERDDRGGRDKMGRSLTGVWTRLSEHTQQNFINELSVFLNSVNMSCLFPTLNQSVTESMKQHIVCYQLVLNQSLIENVNETSCTCTHVGDWDSLIQVVFPLVFF